MGTGNLLMSRYGQQLKTTATNETKGLTVSTLMYICLATGVDIVVVSIICSVLIIHKLKAIVQPEQSTV